MKQLLTFIFIAGFLSVKGQDKQAFKDRLYYGGNVVFSINSVSTVLGASPLVGYKITDKLSAGVGISYFFYSFKYGFERFNTSIYGGNIFSRFIVTDNLFLQTEFHIVNTDAVTYDPINDVLSTGRKNVPIWYVGGGLRQPIGANTYVSMSILYDLIDDINSPYTNPIFRGGLVFGF